MGEDDFEGESYLDPVPQEEDSPGEPYLPSEDEGEEEYEPNIIEVSPEEEFEPQVPPSLDPTWSVLDSEPGMDKQKVEAGDSLKDMEEELQIKPFKPKDGEDRLFLGRFEFLAYDGEPIYRDALKDPDA